MGGTTPELVVLGSIGKQVEQAMRSKVVSNIPPWHLHQLFNSGSFPVCVPVWTAFSDGL